MVGFARRPKTDDAFRGELREAAKEFARVQPVDEATWRDFASRVWYHQANFDDPEGYRSLRGKLCGDDEKCELPGNCLFYLATQPRFFDMIAGNLSAVGLNHAGAPGANWSRIIVEKPFGTDLAGASGMER